MILIFIFAKDLGHTPEVDGDGMVMKSVSDLDRQMGHDWFENTTRSAAIAISGAPPSHVQQS